MIFPVLFHGGSGKAEGHDEEKESRNLQPQLMGRAAKRSRRGADPAHHCAERATASGLLSSIVPGNSGHHAQPSQGRNFIHGLDFNSLWRYNDATCRSGTAEAGRTVLGPPASNRFRQVVFRPFMQTAAPDFAQLKSGMKAAWMAGDFGQIAGFVSGEEESFVARLDLKPGMVLLDVACGTGNSAIPAARAGAKVTGVDIATNLLEQARKRAAAEQLDIRFEEGDAEELPFTDRSFDVVVSIFGAMFAPRPERVAAEFLRVSKSGGMIAMANWTSQGFVSRMNQVTAKMVPPPPGIPVPSLWGDESAVRQRLGHGCSQLDCTRRKIVMAYPFPPKEMVAFFRRYMGPTQMAFSMLDAAGQATLAAQLESLWVEHNTAADGTTAVEGEYLEVRAIRA
jgi:SAM-dependent methyltransferase